MLRWSVRSEPRRCALLGCMAWKQAVLGLPELLLPLCKWIWIPVLPVFWDNQNFYRWSGRLEHFLLCYGKTSEKCRRKRKDPELSAADIPLSNRIYHVIICFPDVAGRSYQVRGGTFPKKQGQMYGCDLLAVKWLLAGSLLGIGRLWGKMESPALLCKTVLCTGDGILWRTELDNCRSEYEPWTFCIWKIYTPECDQRDPGR